jgi:hypothetical protein
MNTTTCILVACVLVLFAKHECDEDKKELVTVYSHCEGNKECVVDYYESMQKPTE